MAFFTFIWPIIVFRYVSYDWLFIAYTGSTYPFIVPVRFLLLNICSKTSFLHVNIYLHTKWCICNLFGQHTRTGSCQIVSDRVRSCYRAREMVLVKKWPQSDTQMTRNLNKKTLLCFICIKMALNEEDDLKWPCCSAVYVIKGK